MQKPGFACPRDWKQTVNEIRELERKCQRSRSVTVRESISVDISTGEIATRLLAEEGKKKGRKMPALRAKRMELLRLTAGMGRVLIRGRSTRISEAGTSR